MIDKTKAYRFRGDSERWEFLHATGISQDWWCGNKSMTQLLAEHLHFRGLLLEYPELPGEDWEFCEADEQTFWWQDNSSKWRESLTRDTSCAGIYCRKKKPVEPDWLEFEADQLPACVLNEFEDGWKPGDRVRVTRI